MLTIEERRLWRAKHRVIRTEDCRSMADIVMGDLRAHGHKVELLTGPSNRGKVFLINGRRYDREGLNRLYLEHEAFRIPAGSGGTGCIDGGTTF